MILAIDTATGARLGSRWLIGLSVMLFSLIVLAENATQLDLSPAYDDLQTNEIYSSTSGWRKPPTYENEWRPEKQEQESRIQFGYDSVYEEMGARGNDYSLDTDYGPADHPPSTQFRIDF
jgi:hypothetical protein